MTKIVAISDTHTQHGFLTIPECDLLIHSGDFSYTGKMIDVLELNSWFKRLKSSGKVGEVVVIGGNHDWICETNPSWVKETFTDCIYLDEEPVNVMGLKIFGSAITPAFNNWAFNRERGPEIAKNWAKIPDDTEVLVTHGPPHGILDVNIEEPYAKHLGPDHLGCEELAKRVKQLPNLKLHVFGHIHSSNGEQTVGNTKFVNASVLDESYQVVYDPRVITL